MEMELGVEPHNDEIERGGDQDVPLDEQPTQILPQKKMNMWTVADVRRHFKRQRTNIGQMVSGPSFLPPYTNSIEAKEKFSRNNNGLQAPSPETLARMTDEEKSLLSNWGLPSSVVAKYALKGIKKLYPWQISCLEKSAVLGGKNLIYSAPTCAGKTMVAEILLIKRVLELGKKCVMVFPFVAVCNEKLAHLQYLLSETGLCVAAFVGNQNKSPNHRLLKSVDIAVCTLEKANSLIGRLIQDNEIALVGTIVADEFQTISDPQRGYLLELLVTKVLHVLNHREFQTKMQIIAMSATMSSFNLLSSWMDADVYITDFRPIPLLERVCVEGILYDNTRRKIRTVGENNYTTTTNNSVVLFKLSLETVLAGQSVIIFSYTKSNCESLAQYIAQQFCLIRDGNIMSEDTSQQLKQQVNEKQLLLICRQLNSQCGMDEMDQTLHKIIPLGIAFHHAGLSQNERLAIEDGFKNRIIRIIVSTSTLAVGVNLPARRIIISSIRAGIQNLSVTMYQQMCGRAGRAGLDTEGESILMCTMEDFGVGIELMQSMLPTISSTLLGDNISTGERRLTLAMKYAVLEGICTGIATTRRALSTYLDSTLLSTSMDAGLHNNLQLDLKHHILDDCLAFLIAKNLIKLRKYEYYLQPDEYMTTLLGDACYESSMTVDDSLVLYNDLCLVSKEFVLDNSAYIMYQIIRSTDLKQITNRIEHFPWNKFLYILDNLCNDDKIVARRLGVDQQFMTRAMVGAVNLNSIQQRDTFVKHARFYTALAMTDLMNEVSISAVVKKYDLDKYLIKDVYKNTLTWTGMVIIFCQCLKWNNVQSIFEQLQSKLESKGPHRELNNLLRLKSMTGEIARALHDSGIKSVEQLAASELTTVECILCHSCPFHSVPNDIGSEIEAARAVVQEARNF